MSAEARAIELVDETYGSANHPTCWSHPTLKWFACRRVNFIYEACGCSSFTYIHSRECNEGGDPDHGLNGDESATFPSENFLVAIDAESCRGCTDLQIIKKMTFYEDRIRNQQCERNQKGKRLIGFCDKEWERDLIFEQYLPVILFPDNAWFEGMKQKLVAAMSRSNPSGSRNPEPNFKY